MYVRGIAVAALAAASVLGSSTTAQAAGSEAGASGRTINVSAWVQGSFGSPTPPAASQPCPEDTERYTVQGNGVVPGPSTRVVNGVTQTQYTSFCASPAMPVAWLATNIAQWWTSTPTPELLVPLMMEFVEDEIDDPLTSWPNMSPTDNWLYVKVPMDFRVNNVASVSVTASVTTSLGSASATITATPSLLTFSSGDSSGSAECSVDEGREDYVPRAPGACSYTYINSSAIAPNGYSFETSVDVTWDISATVPSPALPATLTTSTPQLLPVSEVQALVTCVGSQC